GRFGERRSFQAADKSLLSGASVIASAPFGSEGGCSMWSRRAFLGLGGAIGTGVIAARPVAGLARLEAATAAVADRTPEEVAQDEFYWREIQNAFTLDRTLINLNNGNTCPSPRVVLEACKRYMDMSNMLPVHYRSQAESHLQTGRRGLAKEFGCDADAI